MHYRRILPPESLRDYVSYFWTLDNDSLNKTLRIVADGSPGLIFQHAEESNFYQNGKAISDLFVFGQATTHAEISLGKSYTTGICFHPNALRSIFGLNADELTDNCLELDTLPLVRNMLLREQLLYAAGPHQRIDILCSFLLQQINKNKQKEDKVIDHILPLIIKANGQVSLKDLHRQTQLSERSFERRFKQSVGITPKLFARICNFQASLTALKKPDFNRLTDVAFEHDFADQSHFIRTFKEFAGLSPLQYQKKAINSLTDIPEL